MRFLLFLPVLLSAKLAFAAPLPAFEGTLIQTQNGASVRATIAWQPPDVLQIEIARDDASSTLAQTIVARGDETLVFQSATKRTIRYPFNIAKSWWRGAGVSLGGPANFLFAGTPFPSAPTEGRFLRRDDVLFGGAGQNAYYAAIKTPARRFAASILTQIATTSATRTEKNARAATLLNAQIGLDATGLPRTATVTAAGQKADFAYDLKTTSTPLVITEIPRGVVEETELKAPSAYTGADASSLFNRGASLAANEDFPAAFAAFDRAAQAAPTASAPVLASFEMAMAIRDDLRAARALEKLETLGLDPTESGPRRARLALLRRDYAGAKTAFDSAAQSAPQNVALSLLRADLAASTGQIEAARELWRAILASDAAPRTSQALAAQNLALYATPDEFPALLTSIPAQKDAQKLARALLQLRGGKAPETAQFSDDPLQMALALGLEGAARDEEARASWDTLAARADDETRNRARAHSMTLAARRGDVAASLGLWRELNGALTSTSERDAARSAFLGAWHKAFRSEALGTALNNRVSSAGAPEDDLRLFLSYQELYGASDDVAAAVESGLGRFPRSAFWLGRKAEILVAQANETRGNEAGLARRQQLYGQAFTRLDEAAQAAPDEPFYRFQKALAATQRGARGGVLIDASMASQNRAFAKRETTKLLADFPNDADVLVSAALQNLTLEGETPAREALQLATAALDSAPGDGDRHTLMWAARQALATALKRLNRPAEAAAQWEILLLGARSSGEQSVLSSNYFALMETAGDTAGAARLLEQLASEKWNYSASRALVDAVSSRVAASPLAPTITVALLASESDAAALAAATLSGKRIEAAQRALAAPQPPGPIADANLDRATRDLGLALGKLQRVAGGQNRVLGARAAAFLAENTDLGGEQRLQLLQNALQIEPRDAALRLALIGALSGDAAKTERDAAARVLDFQPEVRRALANAARRGGDLSGALQIAEENFAITARAPEVGADNWQRVAFSLAKAAYSAGQTGRGVEIYTGLSLPQWNAIDRAAALLSRSRSAGEAQKPEEVTRLNAQVTALGLSQPQIQGAISFIDEVED